MRSQDAARRTVTTTSEEVPMSAGRLVDEWMNSETYKKRHSPRSSRQKRQ